MAAAVLGSPAHSSLWSTIKNEKYTPSASGWNDNGGWGSASKAWGSGTGKQGEWGSGEGADEGGWGASGGGWGGGGGWGLTSTSGAWPSVESSGSGGGMAKQATLTDLWSAGKDEKSSSSAPRRDAEDRSSSSSANPQLHAESDQTLESDTSTGWGAGSDGWGTGAGTNGSIWAGAITTSDNGTGKAKESTSVADVPAAPLSSPVLYSRSPNPNPNPNPAGAGATDVRSLLFSPVLYPTPPDLVAAPVTSSSAQPQTHSTSSASHSHPLAEAFPQSSSFITRPDGSAEYHPYPTSYDLRAMWDAGYAGHYSAMDLSADAIPNSAVEESMDRHLERYYWDVRYQSEIPTASPYIHELHHLPEKHRRLFLDRLAHIDYMFSRVERKIYPVSSSHFQSSSPTRAFESQQDRDTKKTVYKALRVLYRAWHDGAEYPSAVDWEGDHYMPYRVGPMVG